jgi:hypothetical protein
LKKVTTALTTNTMMAVMTTGKTSLALPSMRTLPGDRDVIRKAAADQGVIKSLPCWLARLPPPA